MLAYVKAFVSLFGSDQNVLDPATCQRDYTNQDLSLDISQATEEKFSKSFHKFSSVDELGVGQCVHVIVLVEVYLWTYHKPLLQSFRKSFQKFPSVDEF